MRIAQVCAVVSTLLFTVVAFADVKPNQLFSDHAVLQGGMSVPVWGTADPGEKVVVSFAKQRKVTTADADGKWRVKLGKLTVGGPFVMTITGKNTVTINDVLVGEDWIGSGQSNMAFTVSAKVAAFAGMQDEDKEIAAANYPQLRIFMATTKKTYEPQSEISGEWKIATPENAPAFSAVAYLFGRDLNQALREPVGMVVVAFGASTAESWVSRPVAAGDPQIKTMLDHFDDLYSFYKTHPNATTDQAPSAPQTINARPGKPGPLRDPVQDQHQPTVLYNGMVHPIIPFAMRGVIWYQGESIVGGKAGVAIYPHVMEALVKDWRQEWGEGNFPFYCVQLPPLKNSSNNPMVREGQAHLLSLPDTGMAVTLDVGDPTNVHPKNKEPVGDRLSRIALANVYGKKIEFSGPVLAGMQIEGANIVLHFSHAAGLIGKGGPLQWFQVAGADGRYVSAMAIIRGEAVVVHSDEVVSPVSVRYAWDNYPDGANLINGAGLPAAPFRTDSQDALSAIAKDFTGK
ncbi:sialate O-acetylesterase [Granulicella mallensis]|uniref:Sialate O-acetylesterase n=1 Tax=Granulicella mallensis TaxID=940614 RepID=A0A7W7ZUA6_9BACT|nr:sialate O-acetylesterase [Granulicella mallensis]MBB5066285.1 sialate O-acetylesterase [Granulicella mallensis]